MHRVEIIVNGLVQGVGFRYFVLRNARQLGVKGFVKNLPNGEVITIAEGEKFLLDELIEKIKIGPQHAHVKKYQVEWGEATDEFINFDVR